MGKRPAPKWYPQPPKWYHRTHNLFLGFVGIGGVLTLLGIVSEKTFISLLVIGSGAIISRLIDALADYADDLQDQIDRLESEVQEGARTRER